jgi:hypothetical protein
VTEVPVDEIPFTTAVSVLAPVSHLLGISNTAFVVPVVHTPMVEKL